MLCARNAVAPVAYDDQQTLRKQVAQQGEAPAVRCTPNRFKARLPSLSIQTKEAFHTQHAFKLLP